MFRVSGHAYFDNKPLPYSWYGSIDSSIEGSGASQVRHVKNVSP